MKKDYQKQIKKNLKKENLWKKYKTSFHHKQMKFLVSDIAFYFNNEIKFKDLLNLEKQIVSLPKNKNMFIDVMSDFNNITNLNYDWQVLGKLCWYIYQTSTYWKDTKKSIPNIYTLDNYNQLNETRRVYYNDFINSVPKNVDGYNKIFQFLNWRLF